MSEEDTFPVQDNDVLDTLVDHILSYLGHCQASSSVHKVLTHCPFTMIFDMQLSKHCTKLISKALAIWNTRRCLEIQMLCVPSKHLL